MTRQRHERRPRRSPAAAAGPSGGEVGASIAPLAVVPLERRDVALAAALGVLGLSLYASTACRTFYVGDSAELAAAAAVFGIPHPPGYPLFTALTGVLARAVPGDRALAANLVAALYAAIAVALSCLLGRRLGASRPSAAFAAISLGAGATFWAQGTAVEVYGFDVLLALGTAHFALGAHRSTRALVLAALAGGLWIGHRPLNVAYAPTMLGLALGAGLDLRALVRTRAPIVLGAALLGTLPYLWLPIRSLADPAIDVGDPETLERFIAVVRSAPYVRHWLAGSTELGVARVGRHLLSLPRELGLAAPLGFIGLALAVRAGAAERRVGLALGWTILANAAIGVGYHVLDCAPYFLPSSWALAVLAGLGLDRAARRAAGGGAPAGWVGAIGVASALALVPTNAAECDLSEHRIARLAAEDVLLAAPEGAVVVVEGDSAIHGLWYLVAVEHARPDVIVLSPGHMHGWYLDQLRRRYPEEPWPAYRRSAVAPTEHTRSILRALEPSHPLLATPSVALDAYTARGPGDPGRGAVPRGLGSELVPVGTVLELEERATSAEGYFERALGRVLPVPDLVDVDSASIYLEYALALSRAGDLFARSSRPETARRLYRWVLELRPDELEELVRRDAREGLGLEIPALALGAHARDALDMLDRTAAPDDTARPRGR